MAQRARAASGSASRRVPRIVREHEPAAAGAHVELDHVDAELERDVERLEGVAPRQGPSAAVTHCQHARHPTRHGRPSDETTLARALDEVGERLPRVVARAPAQLAPRPCAVSITTGARKTWIQCASAGRNGSRRDHLGGRVDGELGHGHRVPAERGGEVADRERRRRPARL